MGLFRGKQICKHGFEKHYQTEPEVGSASAAARPASAGSGARRSRPSRSETSSRRRRSPARRRCQTRPWTASSRWPSSSVFPWQWSHQRWTSNFGPFSPHFCNFREKNVGLYIFCPGVRLTVQMRFTPSGPGFESLSSRYFIIRA